MREPRKKKPARRKRGARLKVGLDLLSAIRILSISRPTITEMAEEIGLERRTCYRLLETLAKAGMPVERYREDRTTVRLGLHREAVERVLWGPRRRSTR